MIRKLHLRMSLMAIACGCLVGCNQSPPTSTTNTESPAVAEDTHEHGEWWCAAHGVPEEVCALCDTKLVADFKAKGDWCTDHDRPDSQCFVCHPEKKAEFAAQYEAKYGKKPPSLAGETESHEEAKPE